MSINRIRERWEEGEPAIGTWLQLGSSLSAEYLARLGYDFLVIDHEHGSYGFDTVLQMLQALAGTSTAPIVRVGDSSSFWKNSPEPIKRCLDAGALGVIIPHVSSAEEARRAVREAKYPPLGLRSFGGRRWTLYGEDFHRRANEETLLIAIIEDLAAVRCVGDILSVPGVDACIVGMCDLALSMNREPDIECGDPEVAAAVQEVLEAGRKLGLPVGLHCTSAEAAARRIREGFRMVTIGGDDSYVIKAAQSTLDQLCQLRGLGESGASLGARATNRQGEEGTRV
ncbi:MAG: 2-dehydro-3-deoxyglucarate aldolase [Armatimonadetes bacterium]|nr:2-dehydro-3-deoxyglucarate aldolase [Armatimonadota bacterium]